MSAFHPTSQPGAGSSGRSAPGAGIAGTGSHARNPGVPLRLEWLRDIRVDRREVEGRADALGARHGTDGELQAASLLRVVTLIDLTTLSEDDTEGRVRRLCAKARHPVREDLLHALGTAAERIRVAAVCVYPRFVRTAVEALEGSSIPVATVSAGFPRGLGATDEVLDQIAASVAAGAAEIDVVITRKHVLSHRWDALYDEVRSFRDACGDALIKTILATGELGTLDNVARASQVCMMAGADFIKTSTGKERVNATLPVGITMARAIRAYAERTGHTVGFKPAGGIRSAKDALHWLTMVEEELGAEWLSPDRLRFGASSLLDDIEQQLEST
jgi:deoxyribose-phosphate aldolase